ncbi:hypothetical protein JQ543_16240 [Bradyrhizobium diazoefficiens]|nr:hypothetical protein [Bradyrhizobium diazoefficiens]MBR0849304.1 hypothetical protein [Bradyrhizobium diazoefficiens]
MKTFVLSAMLAIFALSLAPVRVLAQAAGGAAPMLDTNPIPFPRIGGLAKPSVEVQPGAPFGDFTVAGTGLAVTGGFANRFVAEEAANVYSGDWGVHFDTSHNWREENADFVVGGVSYAVTPTVRTKVLFGSSSENLGILPRTYVRGELEWQSPGTAGSAGILAIPSITYREFRNGVKETVPAIDMAFYLPEFSDHSYVVMEAKGLATFVEAVSGVGYEIGASATYVMPKQGTFGAEIFGGRMVYDNTLCLTLCSVVNKFVGVRPLVSFYLDHTDKYELIVRGEVAATDFYNIYGGTVGLKTRF